MRWSSTLRTSILAITVLAGPLSNNGYAETDANFSKYCRTSFPNSGPVTQAPGGKIAHYCNQRGTLQGIDLARACELTTGSRNFRKLGNRVLCEEKPDGLKPASGTPLEAADFVSYCRIKFPNSIYQDVPGNFGSRHHCRRPGGPIGFTLQPVDLGDLCRTLKNAGGYRKEAGRIICVTSEKPQSAERRSSNPGNSGSANQDQQNTDGPRPSTPGAVNSDQAGDRDEAGKPGDGKSVKDRVSGDWEMTSNGLRNGLKVRLEVHRNQVTGYIVKYPSHLTSVAREMDGLKPGRPFMFGKLTGNTITGKTRIGIMAASQTMNQRGNIHCRSFVANLESNRENWMPIRIQLTGNTFKGRHKIVGLKGDCTTFPLPDLPPRMKGGYAVFEMTRVIKTCGPNSNSGDYVPKYRALVSRLKAGEAGGAASSGARQ